MVGLPYLRKHWPYQGSIIVDWIIPESFLCCPESCISPCFLPITEIPS